MNTGTIGAIVVVVAVIAVGGAAAFVGGIGPLAGLGGGSGDVTVTPESTGTVWDGSTGGGGGDSGSSGSGDANGSAASAGSSGPPFSFAVKQITSCGTTCRDVTVQLTNRMDQPAEDVQVYTRIFAGNETTRDARIFEEKRNVGTIPAGGSKTAETRVKLSFSEGYRVQQNDGWITIVTTISTADKTVTFKQRRDVR